MTELINFEELFTDDKLKIIFQTNNHLELAKYIAKKYCKFTADDLSRIDLFWDAAFNKSWLYVSEEMVHEMLGYKKSKDMMSDFNERLIKEYEKDIDYEKVTKENVLVKLNSNLTPNRKMTSNRKKYFIITGEAFKALSLSAKTKQGKVTRKYFIKVESLCAITNQAIFKYMQMQAEANLLKSREEIKERDDQLNRINIIIDECVTYKKKLEKNESVYIISSYIYARRGMFKIGKTKNKIKTRNSGHNGTRLAGDKMKVLAEFKVNSCDMMERLIHNKLDGLRASDDTEFFLCPYDLLHNICENIINNDDAENTLVNSVIDTVKRLRISTSIHTDWTAGINMKIFDEELKLIMPADASDEYKEMATFNITSATDDQKKKFIAECVSAYCRIIIKPQADTLCLIAWKSLQPFLIEQMNISKSQFKATYWRPYVEAEEAKDSKLVVQWRSQSAKEKVRLIDTPQPATQLLIKSTQPVT